MGAYPEGSGVKAGLLWVGEFSGNIICGYPSGQGLGSQLDIRECGNNDTLFKWLHTDKAPIMHNLWLFLKLGQKHNNMKQHTHYAAGATFSLQYKCFFNHFFKHWTSESEPPNEHRTKRLSV